MLAGLCNLCDDFGHSNFESLQLHLDDLKKDGTLSDSMHSEFKSSTRLYQKYLKVDFPKEISRQFFKSKLTKRQYMGHSTIMDVTYAQI